MRSLETVFEIRQGTEEKAPPPARPKGILVPSAKDGVLLAVGTEVTGAEAKGPKVFEVRVGTEVRRFRPLTVGDLVEKGQVLAQLDDQRPRLEVQSRQARVMVARANHQAAIATAKEAKARLERIGQLKDARAVSEEEYRAAVLKRDKSHQEEIARREEVRLAEIEVLQAQLDLEQYTIRSPVRGHVRAILRQRGEAVRSLEGVFEIRIAEKE